MKKRLLSLALAITSMVTILSACSGGSSDESGKTTGEEIVLNYPTAQVGVNTSAPIVKQLIAEFNEEYAGKYKVVVEEVPGDANYIEKIKILLANGELPPVIYGAGYNLLDLALEKDLLVDLTETMENDPEWKAMLDEQTIAINSRDGKLYGVPNEKSIVGYYYNEELFAKAGIEAPAETWDEFFAQCDKLLEAGITPLALDTADSAWTTSLWLGAMAATENEAGYDFIQTMNPFDYNTPEFINALENVQIMLQKYTTLDAVGGKYEHAANNFLSGQAAMIANGSWMMGDFGDETKAPAGFDEKVAVTKFPGGLIYNDPMQGYLVTKNDDPAVVEASIAFVKHMTSAHAQTLALETQGLIPASATVEVSDVAKGNFPLLADIVIETQEATIHSRYTQGTMFPNLLDVLSRELPNLANDVTTAEELANILTVEAQKNK